MLAYGKNISKDNQFSVFCPEKNKYHREKKSAQILEKFTQKKTNLSSHLVQPKIEMYTIYTAFQTANAQY